MPSLKDIRKRIASVRNTQQITKAMKMVAAAKLRRAHDAAVESRPYAEKMRELLANLSARVAEDSHPLLVAREEKRIDAVFVTTDRGLCGGYNSNLFRLAQNFLQDHPEQEVSFRFVGRKGADFYRRRGRSPMDDSPVTWNAPPEEIAAAAAGRFIGRYLRGESDGAYILYSEFHSALSQKPTVARLLPVAPAKVDEDQHLTEYLLEPGIGDLLSNLLPKSVEVQIYQALLEAVAGEHGARMTAMESATSNASDLISLLTLQMNRARQAAITTELLEVVSTAEALG
ncbi:MAG: ATP synthase F1 subunit gamma [Deltaproteobacteria bacterium]|nr:ATP synthase F1 subunit gamma [Deltaproteobacteria bacterium]